LIARVEALAEFLKSDDGANLLIAYKRAANIVRIEEKKDSKSYSGDVAAKELGAPEGEFLLASLESAGTAATLALSKDDFRQAMFSFSIVRQPVDQFFDKVTVNTPDAAQRVARLKLLARIGAAIRKVADFSLVEG
jgi:glycyl-tRNA synthetase beta chain